MKRQRDNEKGRERDQREKEIKTQLNKETVI